MINTVILEGLLAQDPVLYRNMNGKCFTSFVMACNRTGYGKGADFIKIRANGSVAEALCEYKKKGGHICVIGSLTHESYENYKKETVYETLVNAKLIEFWPDVPDATFADQFFDEYPEIKNLYKKFASDYRKQKKAEKAAREQEKENESC